jgi:hypothetical protein
LLLYWIGTSENLDAIEGGGWEVFIASNHFLVVGCFCWRWAHRTVRWCTGHVLFTVRCAPRQHTHWGLEQLTVEVVCPVVAPDSLVPHRTCPVHSGFSALTSDLHCSLWQSTVGARLPLLCWLTGHVRCTPDSPVNYSGACPEETREWLVWELLGLVHRTDTVRCATDNTLSSPLLQIKLSPQLNFFLGLCWTLCTWDKRYLGN